MTLRKVLAYLIIAATCSVLIITVLWCVVSFVILIGLKGVACCLLIIGVGYLITWASNEVFK